MSSGERFKVLWIRVRRCRSVKEAPHFDWMAHVLFPAPATHGNFPAEVTKIPAYC